MPKELHSRRLASLRPKSPFFSFKGICVFRFPVKLTNSWAFSERLRLLNGSGGHIRLRDTMFSSAIT
ncbi:hypothetical protein L596_002562 [Steinernema carpocapsae]|uniref:Uncharacterized protein n=1 Tax=Steinernema carpocapsae TaxID=34508 RepID=A0A4U8URF5_STECR|nr:hypothetical protein L596_002562 [Steinernema carpocapsae]